MDETKNRETFIVGQKYAFATASLIMGLSCFINVLGLEKAILAIIFAWLALRVKPEPILKEHRVWAKTGLILGIIPLILLPVIIFLNYDRLSEILECLLKLNGGR